jgi:DNA-binding protein YbaB
MTNKLMNTIKKNVNKLRKTKKNINKSMNNKIYTANSKYVDVSLTINSVKESMKIKVNYKDLHP